MSEKTKTKTKQPPKIVLPIKRRKEKTTNEEENNKLDGLDGEKFDLDANVNIVEHLQHNKKKLKKQPQPAKKDKEEGEVPIKSKPKLDPFSLQKNEIKLSGKDVYFDGDESDESEEEANSDSETEDEDEEGEHGKKEVVKGKWGNEKYLSRVIYVGHLPFGFFEDQLEGYFSQYGKISKVIVKRNKYTKNSMGFGYIQFKNPEVAKIAAESMNNYLLYGRRLVCEVAKDPLAFRNEVKDLVPIDTTKMNRDAHNKDKTPEQHKKRLSRLLKSERKRRRILKKNGYSFRGYKAALPPKPQRVDFRNSMEQRSNLWKAKLFVLKNAKKTKSTQKVKRSVFSKK